MKEGLDMAQASETQGPTRTTEQLIAELQRRVEELRAAHAVLDAVIAAVASESERCLVHTPPCTKVHGRWVEAS